MRLIHIRVGKHVRYSVQNGIFLSSGFNYAAAGLYFSLLETETMRQTRKMSLLK